MKQLTLTKLGVRMVHAGISAREEAFKARENHQWRRVTERLLDPIADYDGPVQDLVDQADALGRTVGLTAQERDEEIRSLNAAIWDLDESLGQEVVVLTLEDDDFRFVQTNFENAKFGGDRRTSRRVEEITQALDPRSESNPGGCIDVEIKDGQVVPKEAAPTKVSPNGRQKRPLALGRRR